MATLSAKNLAKAYKSRQVVRDVSLSVSTGQIVGLLGPNGAGKTTTFYMIVGLVNLDKGKIEIDDNELTHQPCTSVHAAELATYRRKPLFSSSQCMKISWPFYKP